MAFPVVPLEALRYLHFLKEDGVVVVNDWRIDPITVVTGAASYPEGIIEKLQKERKTIVVEAMAALTTADLLLRSMSCRLDRIAGFFGREIGPQ